MKKITLVLLAVIFVLSCVGLAACNKGAQEALDNYLLEQANQLVDADFVLPATLGEYELDWSSNNAAITVEKREADNDYLAKVNMGDEVTEVTLTVSIGKLSKSFTVRVAALDVHYIAEKFVFPQDRTIVTESFVLPTEFTYGGKTATITWSVDDDYSHLISIGQLDGKTACIVTVSTANPEARIKATFALNGEEITYTYRMTISAPMSHLEEIDYWYNNTGVSMEIRGYVVAIGEAYSEQYGNMCLYVMDEEFGAGYYVYRVGVDAATAPKVKVGTYVIITGSTNTNYNGLIETDGNGTLTVDESKPVIDVNDYVYAFDNDLIGDLPAAIYHQSRLVSLTNWEVKSVATSAPEAGKSATLFTLTKGGAEVTIAVSKYLAGEYTAAAGDAKWEALCALINTVKAGDVVSVTGILGSYNNNHQIYLRSVDDLTTGGTKDPDGTQYPGAKVAAAMEAVQSALAEAGADKRITSETTFTLPTSSGDVTIAYELCAQLPALTLEGGNTFKVVPPANEEKVNVKATYTVKDGETVVYETVDFFRINTVVLTAEVIRDDIVDPPMRTDVDFELYQNEYVTWSVTAGEEALTIEGNTAKIHRGEEDVRVTLTATVTYNDVTLTRNYFVTVIADPYLAYYRITLDVDTMQLVAQSYQDGTVTIDRVAFEYTELGNYGDGIQMRSKPTTATTPDELTDNSTIKNTNAFHAGIKMIVVTWSDTKSVSNNTNALSFKFGTSADDLGHEVMLSTVQGQTVYEIVPDAETYTYFSLEKTLYQYSMYFKSIQICFTEPNDITYTDEEKVDAELAALKVDKLTYTENGTATLPVAGTTHTDVAISWASDNTALVVDGGNLTVTLPSASTRAVLTATVTCGDVSKTKTFPVHMVVDVVDAAYNLLEGETLADMTLTGVIIRVDDAYSEQYKNVTVTIIVDGKMDKLIECFRMTGEQAATIKAGDKITVTGDLTNYKGKIEFNSGCVLTAVTTATADELEYVTLFNLEIPQTVTENFTLPEGATYVVKDGTAIAIDGLNATVTRGEEDATVVITATINGKSLDYTVVVKADGGDEPAPTQQIITIPQTGTFKLIIEQNSREETLYFTGVMDGFYYGTSTNVDEAVDVTVANGSAAGKYTLSFVNADGATQYLYIEKSGNYTNVKFGSTPFDWTWEAERNVLIATLSDGDYYLGTYSNYDTISASQVSRIEDSGVIGVSQFPARFYGTMAEPTDAEKVAADKAALQLEETYTENFTLPTTGVNGSAITWAVTEGTAITVDGAAATVIRGAEDATVTLTATITCGEESDTKAFTVTVPAEGTVVPDPGTEEDPYTVAEALAAAGQLAKGEYSEKVYILGTVVSIGSVGSYYSNLYIADGVDGAQLLVYSANLGSGIDAVYPNDTVLFYGYLTNYNGTLEVSSNKGDYVYMEEVTRGTSTITVDETSSENAAVTLSKNSGENGTEFTFTIQVTEGYQIVSVTVNGVAVEAVEGTYTSTVQGNTKVKVETAEEGAALPVLAASISFADKANRTVFDPDTDKKQVWEQNGITFTNTQASSNNKIADYSDPVRCYQNSDITIEYAGIVKLVFDCAGTDRLLMAESISGGGVLTTDGTTVTITFETAVDSVTITKLTQQARINSIDVYTMAE